MKEKFKKIFTLKNISLFINIILSITIFTFFLFIFKIDILPIRYTIEFIIVFILLLAIFILLDLRFSHKKILIIILDIFSILLMILFSFGIIRIIQTNNFFNRNHTGNIEVTNYYVVVRKNSKFKNIKDVKEETINVLSTEPNYVELLKELKEEVNVEINNNEDLFAMGNDLIDSINNVILISDADYEVLDENIENFKNKTKIIYTISIESVLENLVKDAKVTQETFNIYISGIDTYGKISTKSRSDVNIIMTVNPVSKKILLTSIPRDYYVRLHGTTGNRDKLTHAGVYGINMSIQTIEDLLDIDINYYLRVNFNTLIDVVDELDGIDIDSDKAFKAWTNRSCEFEKGKQHVDGKCALAFARERYSYLTGDRHRGENQQQVITAIINKATSSSKIITNYSNILNALDGSFQTNLSTDEIYALIKMQLEDMSSWQIESISLNGFDSSDYTYSYGSQKLYVMEPDYKTVNNAQNKIKAMAN